MWNLLIDPTKTTGYNNLFVCTYVTIYSNTHVNVIDLVYLHTYGHIII